MRKHADSTNEMGTWNSNAELAVKDDKAHEQANHHEKDEISG